MGVITQPSDIIVGAIYPTKSFGNLKIIKYNNAKDVEIEFVDTAYRTSTRTWLIRNGMVKDRLIPTVEGVGFIGDGIYEPYITTSKASKAYQVWSNIIYRCYSKKAHVKFPTYKDCEVCEEWQDFQCFAEWYYGNYPKDGEYYELDKDIKIKGNRVYSPDACLFATKLDNVLESISPRQRNAILINNEGVEVEVINQSNFCREYGLSRSCICSIIGGNRSDHKGWRLKKLIK